ncbi:MAG: hypothetical protein L3J70_02735 [Gammaproteobacteria bacterium]|nr:hypothetical protein [Gammaproteobacteria bacterium]
MTLLITSVQAAPREQAKRLHDRLTGIPPTAAVLNEMETKISEGNVKEAADIAVKNSAFYNVTLKNFVTPWTNEAQTIFAPLNDYTATVIGMVRDDVPFNQLLSADILYIGKPDLGLPAYSVSNNEHYKALEDQGIDLKENLIRAAQSSTTGLPEEGTAGIMTTRAAAQAFFIDGTNRAMFRFTLLNHLCTDLEQIKDNTRASDRVRQDVSRSPGGDSRIFMNSCLGCHAGMEPLAQAYAYYDFRYDNQSDPEGLNGSLVYTPGEVQKKYLINSSNFKYGYETLDDRWDNYWRKGPNAFLGWGSGEGKGKGASSMGQELANSDAFANCQVEKVFKTTCFRVPSNNSDFDKVAEMTQAFKTNNYNLKQVFIDSAIYCMGE